MYILTHTHTYKCVCVCVRARVYVCKRTFTNICLCGTRKSSSAKTVVEHPIPCKQADSQLGILVPQQFYQVEKAEAQLQMQHNKQLFSMQLQLVLARCLWILAAHAALSSPRFVIPNHQHEPLYTICVAYYIEIFKTDEFPTWKLSYHPTKTVGYRVSRLHFTQHFKHLHSTLVPIQK